MARAPRRPRSRWLAGTLAGTVALLLVLLLGSATLLIRLLPVRPGADASGSGAVPQIVFAEFGPTADHIYAAPADDPARRTLVGSVEHAEGWGINAGPIADGRVAYTVLPTGSPAQRDAAAELWLLDLTTHDRTRLARDADLLVKPQFVDGGALIYRRSSGDEQAIVRVDVQSQLRTVVYAERTTFGIFPIGYDASGALLFARLASTGTDVYSVRSGQQPVLVLHASDEIARDWQLSPDGRALAFLAPERRAERVVYRAQVVALGGTRPLALPEVAASGEQYGPTWTPDGDALAVGQEAAPGAGAPVTLLRAGAAPATLSAPARGFDVPVAWSVQGGFLAARTFDGVNSTNPGRESAVVIAADGERFPVSAPGEVTLVGWLTSA